MSFVRALAVLLFLSLGSIPTARAEGMLKVVTEGAYPPFNYLDEQGHPAGFDVDIARALCQAMDVDCRILAADWDDLLPGLAQGRYDMIVASMASTPERERVADFTDDYYRSRSMFVARQGIPFTQTPEGLAGKKLAAQSGTVQAEYLEHHFSRLSQVMLTDTLDMALDMLVRQKVDAVLTDSLVIFSFLQSPDGKRFDFAGTALPVDDPSSKAKIAVCKGNDSLRQRLNSALREIRLNGTYDQINRKYFPFSIY
ncbi:transporter substrate-binding domain-containing protein [Pseudodesulfovibrio tunisiensis]|uniref:transporter substrate-binding domain-containing protein n=1 Tax=Pseudodesulfovibrio tunisiensis TaxID=463192 RepID=UPI001FB50114|nr:transporter substrate-binding domain-containing protein [Pseudodesulfovibrio tunisiensis]